MAKSKLGDFLVNPNFSKDGNSESPLLSDPGVPSQDFTDGTNDIRTAGRVELSNYASSKTTEAPNQYPLSETSSGQSAISNKTRGENSSLQDPYANNQKTFVPAKSSNIKQTLQSYGLGSGNKGGLSTFFSNDQIKSVVSKMGDKSDLSGHTLLQSVPFEGFSGGTTRATATSKRPEDISPSPDNPEIARGVRLLQHIHDQLKISNRYNPEVPEADPDGRDGPFVKNPSSSNESEALRGLFTIQRNLGQFDRDGRQVSVKEMANKSMAVLLLAGNDGRNADKILETGDVNKLSVRNFLLSGEVIAQQKIGTNTLRMSNLDKGASGQENILTGIPQRETDQQLSTFFEPFDDISTGAVLHATFSILSACLIGLGLSYLLDLINTEPAYKKDPKNPTQYAYGSKNVAGEDSAGQAALSAIKKLSTILFGPIWSVDNNFAKCVSNGLTLMFGISGDLADFTARAASGNIAVIADIAFNIFMSPGYYNNFLRTIVKDNQLIVNAAKSISFSNLSTLWKFIRSITDSPLYKFVMISAGVGDAALKSNGRGIVRTAQETMLSKQAQKDIDPNKLVINLKDKGKEKGGGLGAVRMNVSRWGGSYQKNRNPLSLSTFVSAQNFPTDALALSNNKSFRYLEPKRENIQLIENSLEAEYIPFYIHDLRTHEIYSMPAFITSFGETFNATYNPVKGIGRQDAVRLYQDTERQVTLSFILASFSKEDHDHMWLLINKLVAMCYPQYSAGRKRLLDGDPSKPFIQPFSQVPAASPMVRLRLGDVFKSNYSKFGLSRLFGVNSSANTQGATTEDSVEKTKALSQAYAELENVKRNNTDDFHAQFIKDLNDNFNNVINSKAILEKGSLVRTKTNPAGDGGKYFVLNDDTPVTVTTTGPDLISGKKVNVTFNKDLLLKKESDAFGVASNVGAVDIDRLSLAPEEVKKKLEDKAKDAQTKVNNLVSKIPADQFFSSGQNPVVRSFESTRGRGVAGFITSLALDYGNDKIMWEISPGSRAPQAVTINLGFVPINDLPLGLDYDGQMRNPSHPVGKFAGDFGDVYSEPAFRQNFTVDSFQNFNKNWSPSSEESIPNTNGSKQGKDSL